MKKYIKPELYFESFTLSQNIAACTFDLMLNDKSACVAEGDAGFGLGGLRMFVETSVCGTDTVTPEDYCYTTGSDLMRVLQS
ncbi:MAG: hypothetical protein IJ356_06660 [Erysipelotrichaceae bacterium]|nr:hypothetical protein [Erysipelotrichaceae bacterium]